MTDKMTNDPNTMDPVEHLQHMEKNLSKHLTEGGANAEDALDRLLERQRQRQRTDAIRQAVQVAKRDRHLFNIWIPLLLALSFASGVLTGVVIALH